MTEFQKFKRRLGTHPGPPIATVMTLLGLLAGGSGGWQLALTGAAIIGALVWPPVLITAWQMRNDRPLAEHESQR